MTSFLPSAWMICLLLWSLQAITTAQESQPRPPAQPQARPAFDQVAHSLKQGNLFYEAAEKGKNLRQKMRYYHAAIPHYERFYSSVNRSHPQYQKAYYRTARAYQMLGNVGAAHDMFRRLIRRFDSGNYVGTSAFRLAADEYNNEQYGKALPYFIKAANNCRNPLAVRQSYYYQARCFIQIGKAKRAIKPLTKLAEDEAPENTFRKRAKLALGHLLMQEAEMEKAIGYFDELIETPIPEDAEPAERIKARALIAEAQCYAGMACLAIEEQEQAVEYLEASLKEPVKGLFQSEALLTLMEMQYDSKDYRKVLKTFERGPFAGRKPTLARIFLLAGKSAAHLKNYTVAIKFFTQAEQAGDTSKVAFDASYRRLACFYRLERASIPGQADGFIEIYSRKYGSDPRLQIAKVMKAETLVELDSPEQAADAWRSIRYERLPDELRADALLKSGWTFVDSGDYNEAISSLSEYISEFPDEEHTYLALTKRAAAYLALGDRTSALRDCERIRDEQPNTPLAAFALQLAGRQLYNADRDYRSMVKSLESLISKYTNLSQDTIANTHYWLGVGYMQMGDFNEAITNLTKAIKLVPEFYRERAGLKLIMTSYRMQDAPRLRDAVHALHKVNPNKVLPNQLLTWLGLRMMELGDHTNAAHFLKLASTPDDPMDTELKVWRSLAKAHLRSKNYPEALNATAVLIANESDPLWKADALLDRVQALIGLKRISEAEILTHQALELKPQGTIRANLHLMLGHIYLARGQDLLAASNYLKSSDYFAKDREVKPLALYLAAYSYDRLGDEETAQALRSQIEAEEPDWKAPQEFPVEPNSAPPSLVPVPTQSTDEAADGTAT